MTVTGHRVQMESWSLLMSSAAVWGEDWKSCNINNRCKNISLKILIFHVHVIGTDAIIAQQ